MCEELTISPYNGFCHLRRRVGLLDLVCEQVHVALLVAPVNTRRARVIRDDGRIALDLRLVRVLFPIINHLCMQTSAHLTRVVN